MFLRRNLQIIATVRRQVEVHGAAPVHRVRRNWGRSHDLRWQRKSIWHRRRRRLRCWRRRLRVDALTLATFPGLKVFPREIATGDHGSSHGSVLHGLRCFPISPVLRRIILGHSLTPRPFRRCVVRSRSWGIWRASLKGSSLQNFVTIVTSRSFDLFITCTRRVDN